MQVLEIMQRKVDVADPSMAIRNVARKMRAGNIGGLPVGENDRLIGMRITTSKSGPGAWNRNVSRNQRFLAETVASRVGTTDDSSPLPASADSP